MTPVNVDINHHAHWSQAICLSHLSHWVVRSGLKAVNVDSYISQLWLVYDTVTNNPQISVAYSSTSSLFARGTRLLQVVCGSALRAFILGFGLAEQPQRHEFRWQRGNRKKDGGNMGCSYSFCLDVAYVTSAPIPFPQGSLIIKANVSGVGSTHLPQEGGYQGGGL